MTMTYSRPLGAFLPSVDPAFANEEVSGLQLDSRQVRPGDVFFALAAEPMRSRYIEQACSLGARCVVVDKAQPLPSVAGARLLPLEQPKAHLAEWAAQFYGYPGKALKIVGITGTNGKSTSAFLLAQLLEAVTGEQGGVVGTLGFGHWSEPLLDTGKTTPDAINLQRLFHQLAASGVTQVAMEVSSHALDQGRCKHVFFDAAVYTNLTRDHLDYHGSMAEYAKAKAALFAWPQLPLAVINADDAYAHVMQAAVTGQTQVLTYGVGAQTSADVKALNCQFSVAGVVFDLVTSWGSCPIQSPLLGRFNLENLLASIATLLALHPQAWGRLAQWVAALQPVPGRMQVVPGPAKGPKVVVDYAHTPDALEKALAAVKAHTTGKIWVVFGCGGDRDRGKRPLMAQAAQASADHIVITSDNPRTEDPEQILAEISAGFSTRNWLQIIDRPAAIAAAIKAAAPADWVLIAGKGHETYQIIGQTIIPMSDVAEARRALAGLEDPKP